MTTKEDYVYAYEKPPRVDQSECESCDQPHKPDSAYCEWHYGELRRQVESILQARKPQRLVVGGGRVREAVPGERLWAHSPNVGGVKESSNRYWRYSLTVDQFNRIRDWQQNKCAICNVSGNVKKLHIDHDHACCNGSKSCGACVRGLLCSKCNVRLSAIEDAEYLKSAQGYLLGRPAQAALSGAAA